jgi:hypothetical protein
MELVDMNGLGLFECSILSVHIGFPLIFLFLVIFSNTINVITVHIYLLWTNR